MAVEGEFSLEAADHVLRLAESVTLSLEFDVHIWNAAIRERLSAGRSFLIDLANVPYMDSTSLGTVLDTLRVVRERDGDMRLSGLADNVRRVFDLMDAESVVRIFATPEEAIASFEEAEAAAEVK